jgi:predicted DNA-binding protein
MEVRFSFLVDEELRRKAKIKAAKTGKPMAEVCREALRQFTEDCQDTARSRRQGRHLFYEIEPH